MDCFPDDFDQVLTYVPKGEPNGERKQEDVKKWDSDYQELMEYTKNTNYGRLKCFHCLLSPDGNDPILIEINRLVAKGLNNDAQQGDEIQYPCQVINRFQCPFDRDAARKGRQFDIDDLFRLHKLAFAVEISLAKARKADSKIRIKNKEELLQALTNEKILRRILEQGAEANEASENIRTYLREN